MRVVETMRLVEDILSQQHHICSRFTGDAPATGRLITCERAESFAHHKDL
jgi:hypothetical protein